LSKGDNQVAAYKAASSQIFGMVLVFSFAALAVPLVPTIVISANNLAIAMSLQVTRNVFAVVPVVLHKEDALAAGGVLAAVLAPMSGMGRRYVHIDRRTFDRSPRDNHRLNKYHLWLREVDDVDSSVEVGLANIDRDSSVACACWGYGEGGYRRRNQNTFHVKSPQWYFSTVEIVRRGIHDQHGVFNMDII
jgi:hypothetical protein